MNFEQSFEYASSTVRHAFKNKNYVKALDKFILIIQEKNQLEYQNLYYLILITLEIEEYKLAYIAIELAIVSNNNSNNHALKEELNFFLQFKKACCHEKFNEFQKAFDIYQSL